MPVGTRIERELELPADAGELKRARDFISEAAAEFGFDDGTRRDVVFAANEAVTNALQHGAPSPDGTIRIRVIEEDDALAVYVWDWGRFHARAPEFGPLAERGRGLDFIAAVVDEVEISADGDTTRIRLAKRR